MTLFEKTIPEVSYGLPYPKEKEQMNKILSNLTVEEISKLLKK